MIPSQKTSSHRYVTHCDKDYRELGMEEWIYAVGEGLRFSEKGEFDLDLNEEVGPTQ